MRHSQRNSAFFYIFWVILLLLAIFITILILSTVFPNFKFSFTQLRELTKKKSNTNIERLEPHQEVPSPSKADSQLQGQETQNFDNATQNANGPSIKEQAKLPLNTDDASTTPEIPLHEEEETEASLFQSALFMPSSRFLSRNGKRFLAGSIEINSKFPSDFQDTHAVMQEYSLSAFSVHASIEVGWNTLLSFSAIDSILAKTSQKALLPPVEIPPLEILDIRLSVSSDAFAENKQLSRAVAKIVKSSITAFFDSGNIPAHIFSDAQQALAVAYVSHGYHDIVLFSKKE